MSVVDLNADLGELEGPEGRALDRAILAHVTSVSVACGGHAGDDATMRQTFAAATEAGVQCGAHPSYPDREGFGRQRMALGEAALAYTLDEQVHAAAAAADAVGAELRHLKPHGALYHAALEDDVAAIVANCAARHGLALFGPPSGALARIAAERGLAYVAEGFADRAYRNGRLVPRGEPGAVIEDEAIQADQAVRLARGEDWPDGPGPVRTLCLHGDTPGAALAAGRLRAALDAAGIDVAAPRLT